MRSARPIRLAPLLLGIALLLSYGPLSAVAQDGQTPSSSVRPPAGAVAPDGPQLGVPERPGNYDAEMWRKVREGIQGQVSIPDKKAGQLVQSDGEAWRSFRTGPLPLYGSWAIGGMVALLAAFYLLRGRIRIDNGWSGRNLARFGAWERFCHWLLALSFIVLALTGLNVLYGRYVLLPLLGAETFAWLAGAGKWLHNSVAFAFMLALLLTAINWIPQNVGGWRDIVWLVKGGGMLVRGSHPPAWKFNAGQKILFWLVMLCGLSLSLSGIELLLPFQLALFAKTFALLNKAFALLNIPGYHLPSELAPVQEMQYAASWHSIVALALITLIIAHIYIGTLGMQGAFSAMGNGQVDVNWAKEHHSLWADKELERMEQVAAAETNAARPAPAE
jgi:formate dehydrogenase subunit gamma